MIKKQKFAGIQYLGDSGISEQCKKAVIKLIHFGDNISEVKILTAIRDKYSCSHCLLIIDEFESVTAIKSGFTSGYNGEGPRILSYVLNLLREYTDKINEFSVSNNIISKIDDSCLTLNDMEKINSLKRVHPAVWYEYAYNFRSNNVYQDFPLEIPMALIDERLIDFAVRFPVNPDSEILNAYRLLESVIKDRTSLKDEVGLKLFAKAFQGDQSILYWDDIESGEHKGRGLLFNSIFQAYRNKRGHQNPEHNLKDDLREFLLVNELFHLEKESILRPE